MNMGKTTPEVVVVVGIVLVMVVGLVAIVGLIW